MSVVEKKPAVKNGNGSTAPRMWHICDPNDHSRALCGRQLSGKPNWSEADVNECVVCADIAKSVYE